MPYGNLVQGGDGNFYGTVNGPDNGDVYSVTPAGGFTLLHTFTASTTDGSGPYAPLIVGSDGNFYGMTGGGGSAGTGVVFRITPAGDFTLLHSFTSATGDMPLFNILLQASDGNFYGTTPFGGAADKGVVFKLTPDGTYSVLYSFTGGTDGAAPTYGLVEGSDGNLYGTNVNGGAHGQGVVFKITLGGIFTPVYEFCSLAYCNDGAYAQQLIVGSDGNIYGTTANGGISIGDVCGGGCGTIFKIAPSGTFTTLFEFCAANASCPYGHSPQPFLVQANDGNFYGISTLFFQLTPSGSMTAAYTPDCGYTTPCGYLGFVQGMDGNFYGQTQLGGNAEVGSTQTAGTAIKLTPSPALVSASGAPVQLSFSPASVAVGGQATLSWKVLNAFSTTMQQCYAFVPGPTGSTWSGLQVGTMVDGVYQGSATIYPTTAGAYLYALTCGGVESGFADLTVGSGLPTTLSLITNSPVDSGALLTIAVTPQTSPSQEPVTGTIALKSGSTSLGTLTLVNGTATLNVPTSSLPVGTYPLTATYSGNSQFQGSSATQDVTILANPTTVTPSASTYTVLLGSSVTLSAQVARAGGGPVPGGSVGFYINGALLGTVPVSNGIAAVDYTANSSTPLGSDTLVEKYSGDATDAPSSSEDFSIVFDANTTTTLTVTPSSVASGQKLTITVTVARVGATGSPTGEVDLALAETDEALDLNLVNGKATLTLEDNGSLPVGTFSLTASYAGDTSDLPSTATPQTVTIGQPGATTTTSLKVTPTAVLQGQSVTLTATVTGNAPTGSVTFYEGTLAIGKATLNNGTATETLTVPTTVAPGNYTVTADYSGDSNNFSSSTAVGITVQAVTNTTLTVSPNPAPANSTLMLTAKVRQTYSSAIPTGTVMFSFNGAAAGPATLDGTGTATVNFSTLGIAAGTYTAKASYGGDADDGVSTSAPVSVTIQ